MSQAHTWAPEAANPWTMARPIPWAAPVTSTVFPLNSMFIADFEGQRANDAGYFISFR